MRASLISGNIGRKNLMLGRTFRTTLTRPYIGISLFPVVLALLFLAATLAQADINVGVVAYYPFNGNANDESGNGNDGTVNGATLAEDRFGNINSAYSFDGNDFIDIWSTQEINDNIDTTQGSISVWFKLNARSPGASSFVYQYTTAAGSNNDRLYLDVGNSGSPGGKLRLGIGDTFRLSDTVVVIGHWYHVVAVWDIDGSTRIYIDGLLDSVGGFGNPGFEFQESERFYFGRGWTGNVGTYDGLIDDIRIYNLALSEDEVQEIYDVIFIDGFE